MLSEVMDLEGLSSCSFFSEDSCFRGERQAGFWKSDTMLDHFVSRMSVHSATVEKLIPVTCQTMKPQHHPEPYLMQDQEVNLSLETHAVGAKGVSHRSETLLRPMEHDRVESPSYIEQGNKIMINGVLYEKNHFSSSLSELFSKNLRLPSSNALYGHSFGTVDPHLEEEELFESLEEIEAQTIGNLLPDDDDLFYGVTERVDWSVQPNSDDMEELDLFSSVGGMDLGDDVSSAGQRASEFPGGVSNGQLRFCNGSVAGEHPYGEHPSRTLFVRNINSNVEDFEIQVLFKQYGDIRTLYTACKHRGFVMISYYDIRAARNAMNALQNKPLRRRKLDIHYSIPKENPSEKEINQGTLVVLNLDSSVTNYELQQIFGVYGEIKEIHETPHISDHKFIEFFDVRAAEAALLALNRSDIAGKQIKVEPRRPGCATRTSQLFPPKLEQTECGGPYVLQNCPPNNSTTGVSGIIHHGEIRSHCSDNGTILGSLSAIQASPSPFLGTAFLHGISSSVPNCLPSLTRVEAGNQSCFAVPTHSQDPVNFDIPGAPSFYPHSLPEYHDGLIRCNYPVTKTANVSPRPPKRIDNRQLCWVSSLGHTVKLKESDFGSSSQGSFASPGLRYTWSNSYNPQPPRMVWSESPSPYFSSRNINVHPPSWLHGRPRAPSHMLNTVIHTNKHCVGSAPTVFNPFLWDNQCYYAEEFPEASGYHPGSLGDTRMPNNSRHSMEFVRNIFPHVGGSSLDMPIHHKNVGLQFHQQRGVMFPSRGNPMVNTFYPPNEHPRSPRNDGSSGQADNKKQYELDIDRLKQGGDDRTTLMIKNIPNKYTSKLLLAAIDERHCGTYDFIYLPIDFKNKCNVGYAFINMTDTSHIIPFYQAFNGKKWEKFNSEKVASLAYARIQGKAALVTHFQNSSLMNEDKQCRPILFNTDGPNAGDQVPFPMGVNIRSRPGKARTNTNEVNHQGNPPNLVNGEDSSNGDSSSSSGIELD